MLKVLKWDKDIVPVDPIFEDVPVGVQTLYFLQCFKTSNSFQKSIYTSNSSKHVQDMNVRSYKHTYIKHEIIHN